METAQAEPYDYFDTKALQWADPAREPLSYEQYLARHPLLPFQCNLILGVTHAVDDTLPFLIVVNASLYSQVDSAIARYIADIRADNFAPILYTSLGGTPQEFKDSLIIPAWQMGAVGALLVGDLPVPWFELYHDFDNNGIPDDSLLHDFPCDLFYMDIDGVWGDTTGNGIYDLHQGNMAPEFWIGRLTASPLLGDEAQLTRNYFAKNHAFRTGALGLPPRALAYIDDDWAGGAPAWAEAVELTWDNTDLVNEINTTTADDYITRWDDDYQHLLLASHSSPILHSLKENWGQQWGTVFWHQISAGNPHFLFYNLFACSNCRYVEDNYCGGIYIFDGAYGINAVGSSKTGSMLFFEDYYAPLGLAETVGESLNRWFALHGNEPGAVMWSRSWFYGMTNSGDPALRIVSSLELISHSFIDDCSGFTIGDGDGVPDAGETVELRLTFFNRSSVNFSNLTVTGWLQTPYAQFLDSTAVIPSLAAGDSAVASGLLLELSRNTPDNYIQEVLFEIREGISRVWYQELEFAVRAEMIEMVSYQWREIIGNGNGIFDEGETIGLTFTLKNIGGNDCFEENPFLQPLTTGIIDTSFEGRYYFPIDTAVQLDEMALRFVSFPGGNAAAAALAFHGPFDDVVREKFYLPGGDNLNIVDYCDDDRLYISYPVNYEYNNAWNVDSSEYYSPPASYRFGAGPEYPAMADGALELPFINLLPNTMLTFIHKYDIEAGYDGGILEIWDGEQWSLIHPAGDYPGISVSNGSFPSVPCYNGLLSDWSIAVFDLSSFTGGVKIRFRFGSDGGLERQGWFIDDIRLWSLGQGIEEERKSPLPVKFALTGSHPNPFNASTDITFSIPQDGWVKLTVYNTMGRRVAALEDGLLKAGMKRYRWDASRLPSGIYFYRLDYEGKRLTGKCLLLK